MTAGGPTLDDDRRALYAGPRATFVERRKELAGEARSHGDRDRAKLIADMRKPTAAAHLVNLLAQADDDSLRQLVELGTSIRRAMERGDDSEMRSLLQGRAAAIAEAVAQARRVAGANGESVSGAIGDQIVQTLRAAMASDEAAATVRSGALAEALDEPGFEGFSMADAQPATARPAAVATKAQPRAERAKAEVRIKSAAAAMKRAEQSLAAATERRDEFGRQRELLAAKLAHVDDELIAAQAEVDAVEAQLDDASAELKAATEAVRG